MRSLRIFHGDAEFNDDAVIVCLDWTGGHPSAEQPRGVAPLTGRADDLTEDDRTDTS
jgi:hypothetical protein